MDDDCSKMNAKTEFTLIGILSESMFKNIENYLIETEGNVLVLHFHALTVFRRVKINILFI